MSTSSITTSSFTVSVYDRLESLARNDSTDSRSVAEALGYPTRRGVLSSPQDRLRRGMDWEPLRVSVIERSDDDDVDADRGGNIIIATLLLCPPVYTTPWQAACYSIQHDLDPLPVEYFVQQVFAAWTHTTSSSSSSDNNNATTPTARDALTGCVEALLTAPPRQHGILASILVHCSATASDYQLLDHVLNVMFAKEEDHATEDAIQWETTLATPTLQPFWRPRDYRVARQRIMKHTTTWCSPGTLVALARKEGRTCAAWTALVVRGLAATPPTTRCAAEQSIRDALDQLRPEQLVEWQTVWMSPREDEEQSVITAVPPQLAWAEVIVLLLLRDRVVHTQPDMVSLFVQLALTKKGPRKRPPTDTTTSSSSSHTVWKRILRLAKCHDFNCDLDRMMESEEASAYEGSGVFAKSKEMSLMGSLVFQTLFYGRKPTRKDRCDAAMIAKCWIQAACAVQQSKTQPLATSVAALGTVYFEVPAVREFCIETMLKCLEPNIYEDDRMSYIISTFVGNVVASVETCRLPGTDALDHIGALADTLHVPLTIASFCKLARSLEGFHPARTILLGIFKRACSSVHLVRQGSKEEDDVKRGLVAGLVLLSKSVWDKPRCKAWERLSTIIVDNNPHLSFSLRQWMFGQMKQAVVRGWFCHGSCQRLFAACASRIFDHIYAGTESAAFCFQKVFGFREPDNIVPTEAMLELFDLATSAYNRIGPNSTVRCHSILRCLIEPGRPKFPYNSTLPLALVFDAVLVSLFLALAEKETESHGLHRVAGKVTAKAHREVKQVELDFFSKFRIVHAPPWVLDTSIVLVDFPGKYSALLKHEIGQLQSSLVDVVLGLLLGSPSSGLEPATGSFNAALLIGEVLERRRIAQSQQQKGPCDRCSLHIDGFCSIFVPALRSIVEGKVDSFRHVGTVLSAVKNFCGLVQASPGVNPADRISLQRQVTSTWKLYQAGFNEASSLKLVTVLELHVASPDPRSPTCGIQLTRHEDVDFIIQRLRLSVVELIFEQLSVFIDSRDSANALGLTDNEMIPVCTEIVSQLSSDLSSGLRGSSGGLTHNLFTGKHNNSTVGTVSNSLTITAMANCIDANLQLLQDAARYLDGKLFITPIVDMCLSSSKSLESILCSFVLEKASLVKKLFFLYLSRIPCLFHQSLLSSLVAGDLSRAQNNDYFAELMRDIFDQLVVILQKKKGHSIECDADWARIAGSKHLRSAELLTKFDPGTPSLIRKQKQSMRCLSLPNKKLWAWGFESIFRAYETIFHESDATQKNGINRFTTPEAQRTYTLTTARNLVDIVDSIRFLLALGDEGGLVTCLPKQVKLCVCSCVDALFALLDHAMKNLRDESDNARYHGASFIESSAVVAAWLLSHDGGTFLESDVCSWRKSEEGATPEARDPHQTSAAGDQSDASVVKRINKIVSRIDTVMSTASELACSGGFLGRDRSFLSAAEESTPKWHVIESILRLGEPGASFGVLLETRASSWKELSVGANATRPTKRRKSERSKKKPHSRRTQVSHNHVVTRWLQLDGEARDTFVDLDDFLVDD